jgi:hypothetical protein
LAPCSGIRLATEKFFTLWVTAPVAVQLADGTYTVTLTSFDPHHAPGFQPEQTEESWVLEAFAGAQLVYTSPAIPDLPTEITTLVQMVEGGAVLNGVTSVRARHVGTGGINSIMPACVTFGLVEYEEEEVEVAEAAVAGEPELAEGDPAEEEGPADASAAAPGRPPAGPDKPTEEPTDESTPESTEEPSEEPTPEPTEEPTEEPSDAPPLTPATEPEETEVPTPPVTPPPDDEPEPTSASTEAPPADQPDPNSVAGFHI